MQLREDVRDRLASAFPDAGLVEIDGYSFLGSTFTDANGKFLYMPVGNDTDINSARKEWEDVKAKVDTLTTGANVVRSRR